MNPTPSPDTVEPTDPVMDLLQEVFTCAVECELSAKSYDDAAKLIRQHVAAEVARETAEKQALIDEAARVFYDPPHMKPYTWGAEVATKLFRACKGVHRYSPPPPNAV